MGKLADEFDPFSPKKSLFSCMNPFPSEEEKENEDEW